MNETEQHDADHRDPEHRDIGRQDAGDPADSGLLAPRAVTAGRKSSRRWLPILVLAALIVVGGVVVTQMLTSAVDYYCNVDEIGDRSGCDPDRRIRVQGVVEAGTVRSESGVTHFAIEFNGASLPVSYDGEPGGIFKECVPVVVHGELDSASGEFRGDRVEVKHSDNYVAENAERIDEADQLTTQCSSAASTSA